MSDPTNQPIELFCAYRFDSGYIIDTNTKYFQGTESSVTAFFELWKERNKDYKLMKITPVLITQQVVTEYVTLTEAYEDTYQQYVEIETQLSGLRDALDDFGKSAS